MKTTHTIKSILLIVLLGLMHAPLSAQEDFQLIMEVVVTNDGKKMSNAMVELKKNGSFVKSFKTNERGDIDIPLDAGAVYELAITGNGMIKKKLEINTQNIPAEEQKGNAYFPAEVDIFPKVEGLDYKILDDPIGIIRYDPEVGGFDADLDYTRRKKAALDKLQSDYEKQKEKEEKLMADKQKAYDAAIKAADKAFGDEEWELAEQEYKKAAELMPTETYPSFQLAELETKLIKIRETNAKYNEAIKLADEAAAAKDYQKAMAEYKRAAGYKPDEDYPQDKADEMQDLLAEQVKRDQTYLAAIERGDNALKIKDLNTAKAAFEEATAAKPEENYPKNKLAEINDILNKEKAKEEEYNKAIAAADEALAAKEYEKAKSEYEKAVQVKPTESYPQEQIAKVQTLMAEAAKREQNYLAAIEKADNALQANELENAIAAYEEAGGIKPEEEYPKNKIKEINDLIAKKEAAAKEYQDKIDAADKALADEDYELAKSNYQAAADLKPTESYPGEKIKEIEGILAAKAKADQEYQAAIAAADKALAAEDFATAKEKYNAASAVKPEEEYPKEKLAEIGDILVKIEQNQAAYDEAVKNGDEAIAANDLEAAKKFYEEAKGLMPEESYPQQKLDEITQLIAEKAAKEKEYTDAIAAADAALKSEDLETAKSEYTKAKGLKPEETYPQEQLAKVQSMLAEAEQEEQAYLAAIEKGDNALQAQDLQAALSAFNEAKDIRPPESYPQEKITEIEALIKAAEEKEAKYAEAIATADKAFEAGNFEEAKTAYQNALSIKEDPYPKSQITAADEKLAAIAAEKAAAEKLEADYQAAIAEGESKLSAENYSEAITSFQKAAELKPEEQLPKDKISEIEKIQQEIAAKKAEEERLAALQKEYDEKIASADQAYQAKNYKEARTAYQEALALKSEESYPKEKVEEINGILADAAEQEELYTSTIAQADQLLAEEKWEDAKAKYQEASSIKSEEAYPKEKIGEIDQKLAELAAKQEEIRLKQEKEAELQAEYEALLKAGDDLANESEYQSAKGKYQEALELKDDQLAKDKIAEMEAKIAEKEAQMAEAEKAKRQAQYDALVKQGDQLFNDGDFKGAEQQYKSALEVKDDQYPKDQIAAIEEKRKELAAQEKSAEIEAKYLALIQEADQLFEAEDYTAAKSKYQEALGVKEDAYPKDQIAAIEARLAEQAQAKQAAQAEAKYISLIAEADALLEEKNLTEAKSKYQEALAVKEEQYPKDQIAVIDEQLDKKAEKEAALAAAAELEENYSNIIASADKAFNSKDYQTALSKYQEAIGIKEGEPYPAEKIEEINAIIAQQKAKANKNEQYQNLIAEADQAVDDEDFDLAKEKYQAALDLKPNEAYPQDQLNKMEELIAESQARREEIRLQQEREAQNEAAYQTAISEADKLYSDKNYEEAINRYELAQGLKPSKSYPADQIQKIRDIQQENLLEARRKAKENEERENRYLQLIAAGNKSFKEQDYQLAKREYEAALAMKPKDPYPKAKINEINSILRGNEIAEKKEEPKQEEIKIQKGPKATIDGDAEAELDRMYKEMWAKRNVDKNEKVEEKREVVRKLREEDLEKESSKRLNAIEKIENISISMVEQRQNSDELHLQNFEMVKQKTEVINESELELIKESERKRNNAMIDKDEMWEEMAEFRKRRLSETVDGKKEEIEADYEKEQDFRKENSGEQQKRIEGLSEEYFQKDEDLRKVNRELAEDNLNKNTDDINQRQEDWRKAVDEFQNESRGRSEKENERVNEKAENIREFVQERTGDYEKGYVGVQEDEEDYREFNTEMNQGSERKRLSEQEKINDVANGQREARMEGNEQYSENYIEVVEKTEALETEETSLQEESEERRQKNVGKEYYEGEDRPRQDPEAADYPQGYTEKIIENSNGSTTIRRIRVEGTQTDIYEKTLHPWGGVFYTKNGNNISKETWDSESK